MCNYCLNEAGSAFPFFDAANHGSELVFFYLTVLHVISRLSDKAIYPESSVYRGVQTVDIGVSICRTTELF